MLPLCRKQAGVTSTYQGWSHLPKFIVIYSFTVYSSYQDSSIRLDLGKCDLPTIATDRWVQSNGKGIQKHFQYTWEIGNSVDACVSEFTFTWIAMNAFLKCVSKLWGIKTSSTLYTISCSTFLLISPTIIKFSTGLVQDNSWMHRPRG